MRPGVARTPGLSATLVVALLVAPIACASRGVATTGKGKPGDADASPTATVMSTSGIPPADAAASGADAGVDESIAWKDYFSLEPQSWEVRRAYETYYAKMPTTSVASLEGAVVLCQVTVTDSAPLPTSKWDRANGRDLLLEVTTRDGHVTRVEGELGRKSLHVRAEDEVRLARSGASVRWVVRDRDQEQAFPYVNSVVVGTFELPRDFNLPLHAAPAGISIDCRGAKAADVARFFLADADLALAEAERQTTWGPSDPRHRIALREDLRPAADKIRLGRAIAASAKENEEWARREERLRAIVRRYVAAARDEISKRDPVPVGVWARVGPTLSARTKERVCPAVPKGADPGSLNDDQRAGCGLVVELRSTTKLKFDPNPWGPAYACRRGPIDVESLDEAGEVEGMCTLAFRRGGKWLKDSVELSPTEPTAMVLGSTSPVRLVRVTFGDARALLVAPTPTPTP